MVAESNEGGTHAWDADGRRLEGCGMGYSMMGSPSSMRQHSALTRAYTEPVRTPVRSIRQE
jgi:hypothetical protein